jgi:hypothetical protein
MELACTTCLEPRNFDMEIPFVNSRTSSSLKMHGCSHMYWGVNFRFSLNVHSNPNITRIKNSLNIGLLCPSDVTSPGGVASCKTQRVASVFLVYLVTSYVAETVQWQPVAWLMNWDTISDLPRRTEENHETLDKIASVWTEIWKFCESSDAFASTMPQIRQLVAGLSIRQPGFNPKSICAGFVRGKVALGQVFLSNSMSNANSHSDKWSASAGGAITSLPHTSSWRDA